MIEPFLPIAVLAAGTCTLVAALLTRAALAPRLVRRQHMGVRPWPRR